MSEFVIEIAGIVTGVQSLFESTPVYFSRYLSNGTPQYNITVSEEQLPFEQSLLDLEADQEGLKRRTFTAPFLERTAIARMIAQIAADHSTILLHGSTVAVDGSAYLFTAPCGIGKSTHVRFWRELFGDRAVTINDDRAFLQIHTDSVLAFGSPWSGKHGIDTNTCAPLRGICILDRGSQNHICPLTPTNALPFLKSQTFIPAEDQRNTLHSLVSILSDRVPLWKLSCIKHISAAETAWQAMCLQEKSTCL